MHTGEGLVCTAEALPAAAQLPARLPAALLGGPSRPSATSSAWTCCTRCGRCGTAPPRRCARCWARRRRPRASTRRSRRTHRVSSRALSAPGAALHALTALRMFAQLALDNSGSPVQLPHTGWAVAGGAGKRALGPVSASDAAAAAASNARWVEDCAIHLLCVLALDRFGDFLSDQVGGGGRAGR